MRAQGAGLACGAPEVGDNGLESGERLVGVADAVGLEVFDLVL